MALERLNSPESNSQIVRQLESGLPNFRFTPFLEKEFRAFHRAQLMSGGRRAAMVALIFVLAVTGLVSLLGATPVGAFPGIVAAAVLAPLSGVMLLATSIKAVHRHHDTVAVVCVSVAGVCCIYLAQIATLNGSGYLIAGAVLILLSASNILGLRPEIEVGLAVFLVVVNLLSGVVVGLPAGELIYFTAVLGAASGIGTAASYRRDQSLRNAFVEQRLLNELAQRDGLTGLYNRRTFDDYIQRVWRQARREQETVEIIFIDIDHFKNYNDFHGHQAGDDCLRQVALSISRAAKRPFDFGARYGGEEFVLVLYGPPADYARELPEQLRKGIIDLAIRHSGSSVAPTITVSIGVALADPASGRSLTGAIQAADEALYEAKRNGRNCVVFKDASDSEVETGNFRAAGYSSSTSDQYSASSSTDPQPAEPPPSAAAR